MKTQHHMIRMIIRHVYGGHEKCEEAAAAAPADWQKVRRFMDRWDCRESVRFAEFIAAGMQESGGEGGRDSPSDGGDMVE